MNLDGTINQILSFFISPQFPEWFFLIKIFFIIFGIIFLFFIIWFLLFTSWLDRIFLRGLREFFSFKPYYSKSLYSKWKKIENRILSGIESELKLAVLEADEMLNNFLTKIGYGGNNLEEKLEKLSEEIVSNLKEIRFAHQVRNDIIEDPNYKISPEDAKKIISIYEKALKDLQAL